MNVRPSPKTQTGPTDADLLARTAAGDLDALGSFFDRYVDDVRRFMLRLGVSEGDADDLVQLTFLDVPKASARFESDRDARAWLLGIASMHVRRHRRSMARWVKRIAGRTFETRRLPPVPPDEQLSSHQEQARFRAALATLSPKKREVFVLVNLEGASGEEVAKALGIPVATVWTRLHHARKALRAALESDGGSVGGEKSDE